MTRSVKPEANGQASSRVEPEEDGEDGRLRRQVLPAVGEAAGVSHLPVGPERADADALWPPLLLGLYP